MDIDKKAIKKLKNKLDRNYEEQMKKWLGWSKNKIIYCVEEITAVQVAYNYLSQNCELHPKALNMLLGWGDPLQEVAEELLDKYDWGDLYFVIENMVECEQVLAEEAKFREMDFAADNKQPNKRPSVLEKLKRSFADLSQPKVKAAAKHREEER